MGARFWTMVVCAAAIGTGVACGLLSIPQPGTPAVMLPGQPTGAFTPAHPSFSAAINAFFWRQPDPVQPIEFPHIKHAEQGLMCADCHSSVALGPMAGIPSLNTCMACHASTAIDKPLIKQITAWQEKGLDVAWMRVNRYTNQQHVRFNHAPHINANVECATCHGDVAKQTVAQRNIKLSMGFCVSCHEEKNASNDCLTCHF